MQLTKEITFIFLGDKLPGYAKASLVLASEMSGLKICLIGNRSLERSISEIPLKFIATEDFYNPQPFQSAANYVYSDHNFRGGFWLKSLERLFVLGQYMTRFEKSTLLHAELDQLLFRCDKLAENLDSLNLKGLFVPFHNQSSAIASLLFVNDSGALNSLLAYASSGIFYPNEMYLIAEWARKYPDKFYELPTVASQIMNRKTSLASGAKLLSASETGGLIDAAQIGQWVAGIDPKNVGLWSSPANKYVDTSGGFLLTKQELQSVSFALDEDGVLSLSSPTLESDINLYNLHIHSKLHAAVRENKISLEDLIRAANAREITRFPGARRMQLVGWFDFQTSRILANPDKIFSLAFSSINNFFGLRLSSKPFISGDSFRAIADFVWEKRSSFYPTQVSAGSIIFCEPELIDELQEKVLNHINCPVVLILGNARKNVDKSLVEKIRLNANSAIFSQNLSEEIPGVIPLPLGLENRWKSRHGRVLAFISLRRKSRLRVSRILWGFTMGSNIEERSKAARALMGTACSERLITLSPSKHRKRLSVSQFIASPSGRAFDTHRTWEAMYLGCVPILTDSYLSRYYKAIGLPVWVVDSFDELAYKSENDLNLIYLELSQNFRSAELDFSTWQARIRQASQNAASLKSD